MPFSHRLESRTLAPREVGRDARSRGGAGTVQAAVWTRPGRVEIRTVPRRDPGPGQVRIRLEGCGVCASNIPVWEGRPWFEYPLEPGAPGHEGWGTVDAVGPGVDSIRPGERVAALSDHAFAECDLAHAGAVVKLPAELDGMPFPGEPLGCAMNVFRRGDIRSGQSVAVVGIGFLGALLVRLAKNAGAHVVALSGRPYACEVARWMGADMVVPLQEPSEEAVQHVYHWAGPEGCDRVIEATGHQRPLDVAAELVRVRGKLMIAGFHQDGDRQVNMQRWNWRGIDVINAHEREQAVYVEGIRQAVQAVAEQQIDPMPLFTDRFSLAELPEALEAARKREDGFLKALVLMD